MIVSEKHACDHVHYFSRPDRLSSKIKDYHQIHAFHFLVHDVGYNNSFHPCYSTRNL